MYNASFCPHYMNIMRHWIQDYTVYVLYEYWRVLLNKRRIVHIPRKSRANCASENICPSDSENHCWTTYLEQCVHSAKESIVTKDVFFVATEVAFFIIFSFIFCVKFIFIFAKLTFVAIFNVVSWASHQDEANLT